MQHRCTHCEGSFPSEKYLKHVKKCIAAVLKSRSAPEQSARYFESVYKHSRYENKVWGHNLLRRYYPALAKINPTDTGKMIAPKPDKDFEEGE